jgi:hypothetical protein
MTAVTAFEICASATVNVSTTAGNNEILHHTVKGKCKAIPL